MAPPEILILSGRQCSRQRHSSSSAENGKVPKERKSNCKKKIVEIYREKSREREKKKNVFQLK